MTIYRATEVSTGNATEYEAVLPTAEHLTDDWRLEELSAAEAAPDTPEVAVAIDPARWRIYVGSFFDRFGAYKIAILADQDAVIQALIKDASVRKYIDLLARRDDLVQMIGLLQAKGYALSIADVLDVMPTDDEVWHG